MFALRAGKVARDPVIRSNRNALSRAQGMSRGETKEVTVRAEPLTREGFAPFGHAIFPTEDGTPYGPQDAELDLSAGQPRFYVMRVPERGLRFSTITFHERVTQVLGTQSGPKWYLVVDEPGSKANPPTSERVRAFEIEPGHFVKLHKGTWHAGPLFAGWREVDFCNLELSDTNEVDHHSVDFAATEGVSVCILPSS